MVPRYNRKMWSKRGPNIKLFKIAKNPDTHHPKILSIIAEKSQHKPTSSICFIMSIARQVWLIWSPPGDMQDGGDVSAPLVCPLKRQTDLL